MGNKKNIASPTKRENIEAIIIGINGRMTDFSKEKISTYVSV